MARLLCFYRLQGAWPTLEERPSSPPPGWIPCISLSSKARPESGETALRSPQTRPLSKRESTLSEMLVPHRRDQRFRQFSPDVTLSCSRCEERTLPKCRCIRKFLLVASSAWYSALP